MTQEKIIAIWDILHQKNTGDLGFSDLEQAISKVDVCLAGQLVIVGMDNAKRVEDNLIREEHGEIK